MTDQERRLGSALKAMEAYALSKRGDKNEVCEFIDLFADLLHLARFMDLDGEECYRIGRDHYLVEVKEEVACE